MDKLPGFFTKTLLDGKNDTLSEHLIYEKWTQLDRLLSRQYSNER